MPVIEIRERIVRAHYALRPVDLRGRVTDRNLAACLGWEPGQRLAWHLEDDMVILSPGRRGQALVTSRGYLRLPARLRQATSTHVGDRMLFVVRTGADYLIAMPPRVVDEMVTARLAGVAEAGAL
ncbi:hypothetical protein [Nocardia wallacei]|uniref:hypothetical protein n=1 Tax=Nocardia wallacei TaxID=480035 RepID=UPI0024589251|nr:hypothetical protein [Nocardia wallacei]